MTTVRTPATTPYDPVGRSAAAPRAHFVQKRTKYPGSLQTGMERAFRLLGGGISSKPHSSTSTPPILAAHTYSSAGIAGTIASRASSSSASGANQRSATAVGTTAERTTTVTSSEN